MSINKKYCIWVGVLLALVLLAGCEESPANVIPDSSDDSSPEAESLIADYLPEIVSFEPSDAVPGSQGLPSRSVLDSLESSSDPQDDDKFTIDDLRCSFFEYYKSVVVDDMFTWLKQDAANIEKFNVIKNINHVLVPGDDPRMPPGFMFLIKQINYVDRSTVLLTVSLEEEADSTAEYMSFEFKITADSNSWSMITNNMRDTYEYWYWMISGEISTGNVSFYEIIKYSPDSDPATSEGPASSLVSRTVNSSGLYDLYWIEEGSAAHTDEGGGSAPVAFYGINTDTGLFFSEYEYDGSAWNHTGIAVFDADYSFIDKSTTDPYSVSDGTTTWSLSSNWPSNYTDFKTAADAELNTRVTEDKGAAISGTLFPSAEFQDFD